MQRVQNAASCYFFFLFLGAGSSALTWDHHAEESVVGLVARLDSLRELDVLCLDRLTHAKVRDVDLDRGGDVHRTRLDVDVGANHVQDTTLADTRGAANRLDRDLGADDLVEVDDVEIDVQQVTTHWRELIALDHDVLHHRVSVDLEVEDDVLAERVVEELFDRFDRNREQLWLGILTVADCRHRTDCAELAGHALAGRIARGDLERGLGLS